MTAVVAGVLIAAAAVTGVPQAAADSIPQVIGYDHDPGLVGMVSVVRPDGRGRRVLGPGSEPQVSPNGALVAAAVKPNDRSLTDGVVVYRSAGGVYARWSLAEGPIVDNVAPIAFSSDGRYVLVQLYSATPFRIDVIDLQTRRVTLAIGTKQHPVTGASFSPGQPDEIVYAQGANVDKASLRVQPADGSGTPWTLPGTRGVASAPVWGASGIAFLRLGSGQPVLTAGGHGLLNTRLLLWRTPRDLLDLPGDEFPVGFSANGSVLAIDGGTLLIGAHRIRAINSSRTVLAISANGRLILTTARVNGNGGGSEIAIQPATGGPIRVISPTGANDASWNI